MSFREIILENLTNFSSQLVAKVLCSKIAHKWTTMVSDKNRSKTSFQILNNEVEGDWSVLAFNFNYSDRSNYEVYVEDGNRTRLFTVKFAFDPTDKHTTKYVDQSYKEVGNKLYRLFAENDKLTFKQVEQALKQFEATANYIKKL